MTVAFLKILQDVKTKETEKARRVDKKVGTGEDGKSNDSSAKKASEGTSSKEGKTLSEKGEKDKKEAVVDKELLQVSNLVLYTILDERTRGGIS
jgi:hypothetical protein